MDSPTVGTLISIILPCFLLFVVYTCLITFTFTPMHLDGERCINYLCLFLRMHFGVTGGRGSAGLAADNAIVNALQVHLQVAGSAHIQRLFLYPEPGGFIVFAVQFFQLLQRERVQLLYTYDGGVFAICFLLLFGEVEINLAAAEQYFFYLSCIAGKHIVYYFPETARSKCAYR